MDKSIARVVIGLPVEGPFDYKIPPEMGRVKAGQRVMVPFGRRTEMGYVVGLAGESQVPSLKPLKAVLDAAPIVSSQMLQLARWIADYYGCTWGEAVEKTVPFCVRNRKKLKLLPQPEYSARSGRKSRTQLFLSHDDHAAFQELIKRAKACLSKQQGVLFLAPDHVTSQRIADKMTVELETRIARLDLGTSKQQIQDWTALYNGETMCAVGLRSSVFAPVHHLGMVVVFEEHHYGYKEDQSPFYHAREIIRKRSQIEGFDVIFVSCAPTVELWSLVESSECKRVLFPKANGAETRLIDLANYKPRKESSLSFPAANAVAEALDKGERVLVLFNRRGFHTMTRCETCGHVVKCERCDTPFIYLYEEKKMFCPSCDARQEMMPACPECGKEYLHRYGQGIERIESDLAKFFPQAKLATFDAGSKRVPRRANILVATQAVFKVLKDIDIHTAVVLNVDAELSRHDFRCHQKVFSLLMDLKKMVGKTVLVQTRQPNHPALRFARSMEIDRFYREELQVREELGFPPCRHLFEVMVRSKTEVIAGEQADLIYEKFLERPLEGFEAMAPQPGYQAKLRDQYRYIIMGKGSPVPEAIRHIQRVLHDVKRKRGVIVTINVDP